MRPDTDRPTRPPGRGSRPSNDLGYAQPASAGAMQQNIGRGFAAGVKVAFGTDAAVLPR